MISPLAIFLAIVLFFIIFLAIKGIAKKTFCVICASISLTWLAFLFLYYAGLFREPVLIAVLIGESIVGIYYLLEKHIKENLLIFRLPFLLTLTFAAYLLFARKEIISIGLFLGGSWIAFLTIYIYRHNVGLKGLTDRIISCCKNW